MHENHLKMLLRKWENLGVLYDFEVVRVGRECFLAVFMSKSYSYSNQTYRDQREFRLSDSPAGVIASIEKTRNGN